MKNNKKFFTMVLGLILGSAVLLSVCMIPIFRDYGKAQAYSWDDVDTSEQNDTLLDASPAAMARMKQKFDPMMGIDEQTNTVSVITSDALEAYWSDGETHSLTTQEVLYIIQDTLELFEKYDLIVCEENARMADQVFAQHYPAVCGYTVSPAHYPRGNDRHIHKVILYRIAALSSPEAFVFGKEAMDHVGRDYDCDRRRESPIALYYIPSYDDDTDRDRFLTVIGTYGTANDEPGTCGDYFTLSIEKRYDIDLTAESCKYIGAWYHIYPVDTGCF